MKIIRKSYNEIEYRLPHAKQHLEAKEKTNKQMQVKNRNYKYIC